MILRRIQETCISLAYNLEQYAEIFIAVLLVVLICPFIVVNVIHDKYHQIKLKKSMHPLVRHAYETGEGCLTTKKQKETTDNSVISLGENTEKPLRRI